MAKRRKGGRGGGGGGGGGGGADDADDDVDESENGDDRGVDFLNLELSDTNVRDRTLFAFGRGKEAGGEAVEFEVLWPDEEGKK